MSQGSPAGDTSSADDVLWSVIDEHLDEAEFQLERFGAALASPVLGLEQLASIEESLGAHLDGLLVGGRSVVEQRLLPVLRDEEAPAGRMQAAVLVLSGWGNVDDIAKVVDRAPALLAAAATGGVRLAPSEKLDDIARSRATSAQGEARARWLGLAADRRLGVGPCRPLTSASGREEQVAAIRAADPQDPDDRYEVERLLESGDAAVRNAALVKALTFGSYEAWRVCREQAERTDQPNPLALALFAGLGDPAGHQRLIALTSEESVRYAIVRALGYSGNVAIVPWLLQLAKSNDERAAKLAAAAVNTITGGPVAPAPEAAPPTATASNADLPAEDAESSASLPPLEDDDLDADLVPEAEDALPKPDGVLLERWWAEHYSRFDSNVRYLGGMPTSLDAFRAALTTFPLARRHLVTLLLRIRTGGLIDVDTRLFAHSQRKVIAALPTGPAPWAFQYTSF